MAAFIEAKSLKKHFDGGRIRALDGLDLTIEAGEFVSIMGPSGSGKSTLLNMLGALDAPDEGEVLIAGKRITNGADLAVFRRDTVGFVFQLHNLIPSLSAWENVQVPLMEQRVKTRERRRRAVELLDEVGVAERADSLPTKLSGGERQRVAIARALANNPKLIIADEPTGSVDSKNSERVMELLEHVRAEHGTTLIVVTHDADIANRADRVVHMLDGTIDSEGPGSGLGMDVVEGDA